MQPDKLEIFASYTSWKCGEDTWVINFMQGSQNMYLLEGAERALLIDTGWGSGTLRAYVERLTDRPVEVVITHGHLDHSGSCGEWESAMMLPGAVTDPQDWDERAAAAVLAPGESWGTTLSTTFDR